MSRRFLANLMCTWESSLSVHSLYVLLCKLWRHRVSLRVAFHGLRFGGLKSGIECTREQAGTSGKATVTLASNRFASSVCPLAHAAVFGDGVLLCLPGCP